MNIAAVIVNWNKKTDVLNLLDHLSAVKTPAFDTFVVDNASTDGSPDAINSRFPNVTLILNKENLGGTGGFNTGVDYVCKLNRYDYIWLLDNDVMITETTLSELVNTIQSDDRIGMVGSRVMDVDSTNMTVEMGANIRWDIIGTIPVHRNNSTAIDDVVPVDYVAICSALINISALKHVGTMDDRLFLFWDDMEWGLCFNEHGYKVVSASRSIVYHGSFTERDRGPATIYYYGIRNPLLVYSKHTTIAKRAIIFYRSLRAYSRTYFFLKRHGKTHEANLIYKAFSDFINNKWGKLSIPPQTHTDHSFDKAAHMRNIVPLNKIFVSTIGMTSQDSGNIIDTLSNRYPEAEVTVLVLSDRSEYFRHYNTHILQRSEVNKLFYLIKMFFSIRRGKYDAIASIMPTPFIYLGKYSILCDKTGDILSVTRIKPLSFFKLPLLTCWAEIISILSTPYLVLKSRHYNRQ